MTTRPTWLLVTARQVVLGLLLLTAYHVASFSVSADTAIMSGLPPGTGVDMYGLTDTLADPEEFVRFREDAAALDRLAAFYTDLDQDDELTVLSLMQHPVAIADFAGGEQFDIGYGTGSEPRGLYPESGRIWRDVKAFQINGSVADFYRLEVIEGRPIPWESVDYATGRVPILLGSDYRETYSVGDVLEGSMYFVDREFEVVGFLRPHSSVFYDADVNTYLDDHAVIPYPAQIGTRTAEDPEFYGILYFQMIAADIAVDSSLDSSDVLDRLAAASVRSGFEDYTLLNVPSYLVQMQHVRQLIEDNAGLLTSLLVLLSGCVTVIVAVLSRQIARRRSRVYAVRWLTGTRLDALLRRNALLVTTEHVLLTGILAVIVLWFLPSTHPGPLGTVLLAAGAAAVADVLLQGALVMRTVPASATGQETLP